LIGRELQKASSSSSSSSITSAGCCCCFSCFMSDYTCHGWTARPDCTSAVKYSSTTRAGSAVTHA
jgi:hypothetical protein